MKFNFPSKYFSLSLHSNKYFSKLDFSEGDLNISSKRLDYLSSNNSELTTKTLNEDSKYFLHQSLSTPCLNVLKKCKGSFIIDNENRKILDFHGNSVHQVGFGNKYIIKAIKKQMKKLSFCTRRYTNKTAIKLAKKLTSLSNIKPNNTPELTRVLFAPGGTSAMGIALKLARISTKRHKTISMWDSFHGASLDCISIGGEAIFRKNIGPLMPGTEHVPPCDPFRCVFGCNEAQGCQMRCVDYIEYVLEKEKDIAAIIAEPIRWIPYAPPKKYWQRVRELCDKYGTKLIFDEIPNSLGRNGQSFFTYQMYDIVPDILVLGKGLGGGILPFAAVLCKEELNEFGKEIALGHYTHEKNPVLCAAGLATIKYIEKKELIKNADFMAKFALEKLEILKKKYDIIGDIRGEGLLIGVELVKNRITKERAYEQAESIMYKCLEKGLNFKLTMGNIITLCPPLNISEKEFEKAIKIIDESINEVVNLTK